MGMEAKTVKVAVVLLVSMVLGCIGLDTETGYGLSSTTLPLTSVTLDESRLLKVAGQNPVVEEFVKENPGYTHDIKLLEPEDAVGLADRYPVLYGGLPQKTLYRIDYSFGNTGVLVIVDPGEEKVLKHFMTTGVNLS